MSPPPRTVEGHIEKVVDGVTLRIMPWCRRSGGGLDIYAGGSHIGSAAQEMRAGVPVPGTYRTAAIKGRRPAHVGTLEQCARFLLSHREAKTEAKETEMKPKKKEDEPAPPVAGEEVQRIHLDATPDPSGAEVRVVIMRTGDGLENGLLCQGVVGTTRFDMAGDNAYDLATRALAHAKRTLGVSPEGSGVTPGAAAILIRKIRTRLAGMSVKKPKKEPTRFVAMTPNDHALADRLFDRDPETNVLFRLRIGDNAWTKGLDEHGNKIAKPYDVRLVPSEVRTLYGEALGWEPEVVVTFCIVAWARAKERGEKAIQALVRSATHAIRRAPFGPKDELRTFICEPDLIARTSVVAACGLDACGIAVPVATVLHAAHDHDELRAMNLIPAGQGDMLEAPESDDEPSGEAWNRAAMNLGEEETA